MNTMSPPATPRNRTRLARPRWDFGRKVEALLSARSTPQAKITPADLARALDVDHGTVMDWIQMGRSPRAKTAHAVAAWFQVDPAWLLDDAQPYPPPSSAGTLERILAAIPADERLRIYDVLLDPVGRAVALAAYEARRSIRP